MHRTNKYTQQSSINWPVWLNGWVFIHKLSGVGSNPVALFISLLNSIRLDSYGSSFPLSLFTSTSNFFLFMFFANFLDTWGVSDVAGVIVDIGEDNWLARFIYKHTTHVCSFGVHCLNLPTSYKFRKCMVPLLVTHLENCYIVNFGDLFMKYSEAAVLSLIETMLIAQVFLEKVVFILRPPRRSFTDRWTTR